ncbi:MAG: SRPBCC domain-containing protein [Flavobacteriales bacterium]|nr:SRPBCC domain-containing protein [Flavobacteriales bacterium]MBK6945115.1 SRPBCC domain-containing protein [Flavobacteriales bacterium]MBK7239464.1 SRPBCC domain-containing protein [Flavobacteriales bacterium]MBK7296008.1 SRPBCC domain-containing protein [Flavobacteriales bacterium]MBK9535329.1 SRPBCC domain-containing protein [Flavobacteriales bacterium]
MQSRRSIEPHVVSRVFSTPRELVWKANTEPADMMKWFAPAGSNSFVKSMDLRPGGTCHYCQRAADGTNEMWGLITYEVITPIDRMMYIQSFSDEVGAVTAHPLSETWPKYMRCVVIFDDLGNDQTRMTVEWTPHDPSAEEVATFDGARAGMDQGWKGTFDNLEAYLMAERTV